MLSIYGNYATKKVFKEKVIGKLAKDIIQETSMFGKELKGDGKYAVVGPNPNMRIWYATVTVVNGLISKVE